MQHANSGRLQDAQGIPFLDPFWVEPLPRIFGATTHPNELMFARPPSKNDVSEVSGATEDLCNNDAIIRYFIVWTHVWRYMPFAHITL